MASPDQTSPASTKVGAELPIDPVNTGPMALLGEGDASAGNITGTHGFGNTASPPGRPVENDDVANEASGSTTDLEMDDEISVLSRIRTLQEELFKVESNTRVKQKLQGIESLWDSHFESWGRDAERAAWTQTQQSKAQSFMKNTAAFAFGREWAHGSEESFIWSMLERENHEKQLMERRAEWEAKKGVAQPNDDDSLKLKQTWSEIGFHRPFQFEAFLDPLSDESRYNATPDARGYDQQEQALRAKIHEVVRSKYHSFQMWKSIRTTRHPKVPDSNPKDDDVWPRPIMRYMQWKIFKYCSLEKVFDKEERKNLSVMDVLDGEPDLSISKISYELSVRKMQIDGTGIPAGIPQAAQGHVPERIRLNSPHLLQIMQIMGLDMPPDLSQAILLQPYRVLVYHDEEIRSRYTTLKQKFEVSDDTEAVPGDTQTIHHESTDAGLRPTPKGDTGAKSIQDSPAANDHSTGARTPQESEEKPSGESEDSKFPLANTKTALAYLDCLVNFIDTTISIRRDFVRGPECRRVHFRDLWYLFNPGDEILRRDEKQVYRVIGVVNPKHNADLKNTFFNFDEKDTSGYFQIQCVYVDFDGRRLGPVATSFMIKTFEGERSVESLEVYPLRLHKFASDHDRKAHSSPPSSDAPTLRQLLIRRGKKFFRAARMQLENTFYDGPTASGDEVESQVVVDFETALSSDDNLDKDLIPRVKSLLDDTDDTDDSSSVSSAVPPPQFYRFACSACCEGEYVAMDDYVDTKRREAYIDSLIPKGTGTKLPSIIIYPRILDEVDGQDALTDDEYLLMSYRVFAFVLRTRKWAQLDLTYMEDASESDSHSLRNEELPRLAFDQLVLPQGHKNIVLSLISQHYRNKGSGRRRIDQSDIVRGKGKGLILLLHGAPGVGKTSTAEGIAEKFKKPLFTITCGDLGSTAKEVEKALDLNFTLANRWGCILLLDEADVFLASRTDTDFERNGLVAVFLRVLEYYDGILFLTTNRVGVIDEAFRSRIHISLYYPPLGSEETKAVFNLNLQLIQDRFSSDNRSINIEKDRIIAYALDYYETNKKARWNGRQIRNACQTALALAEFKAQGESHERWDPNADVRLAVESFKTVSTAYLDFTKYLKQLYGVSDDVRAEDLGFRARDHSRQPHAQPIQLAVAGGNMPQSYSSMPSNTMQTAPGQGYQSIPAVHMNQGFGVQQPNQQVAYYGNPAQLSPASGPMTYGASGQPVPVQSQQQGQEFMGMQFPPAQGNVSQQTQPWQGQMSPPNSAIWPQSSSAQAQQAMPAQNQQQQQQQQQAPQIWYPNMNVQNMQPGVGQNPPAPSPQGGGQ